MCCNISVISCITPQYSHTAFSFINNFSNRHKETAVRGLLWKKVRSATFRNQKCYSLDDHGVNSNYLLLVQPVNQFIFECKSVRQISNVNVVIVSALEYLMIVFVLRNATHRKMPQLPIPPPQKEYKYVDSLWCTYLISVAASWVAELGKIRMY